jgi:hypothetical protein
MTFRKNFHQIANSDAKCKTYISSDFEQKRRNILLLLLIHTRCDIVLRRFMRKMLYILQKEKFSRERKILLLQFNRYLYSQTTSRRLNVE